MYSPARFREPDTSQVIQLMKSFPFATIVTQAEGRPFVNHLPILVETRAEGEIVLIGHMAKANPQWKHFFNGEALVIFNGPHSYITPQWYQDPMNVPTWNYAVVHASGKATPIESVEGIEDILKKSVHEFERYEPNPWQYDLPEEFKADLVRAIVGFENKVSSLEGKFKLSQNRTPEDRKGVLAGLSARKNEMSLKTLELMLARERAQ
jgi:transcriptional regulator